VTGPTHLESEDHGWTIEVGNHPERKDSAAYSRSRKLMIRLVELSQPWYLGDRPYQDHHGGGIWVKDEQGWLLITAAAGIEWSAQFCADPAKVDLLRQQANRIVAGFPATVPGYLELGYRDATALLGKPIVTVEDVAVWTDSIFNASVPMPVTLHSGVLPASAGYHHYPKPIVDIQLFKYADFNLFVKDDEGKQVAVTPVGQRGSGDGRVALAWAPEGSASHRRLHAAHDAGKQLILDDKSTLARQAFAQQS
jgi:Family of unknown function (DUF6424)